MEEKLPILVWTMGKVGTSTASRALSRAGIPALHMHSIRRRAHAGITARQGATPPHVKASLEALDAMENSVGPMRIISMVRDPVARNISAFFENLRYFDVDHDVPTASLIRIFLEKYPHDLPLRWFDLELRDGIGFDVFDEPFDRTERLSRYRKGRYELLIIRSDAELARQQQEISDFVGSPVELVLKNTAEAKAYKAAYIEFKEALSLSEEYVEKIYASKLAQHFWTKAELAEMSLKCLGDSAAKV